MYLKRVLNAKAKEYYFKYLTDHYASYESVNTDKLFNILGLYISDIDEKTEIHNVFQDIILGASYSKLSKDILKIINQAEQSVLRNLSNASNSTKLVIEILNTEFKADSYIVGGFVRDSIAERPFNDIDFCSEIPYADLHKAFERHGFKVTETGKQFLVLTVASPSGEHFEIAALRKDKGNEGAEVGTIEEDAARRDFVNSAIYLNLKTNRLIDPSGIAISDCLSNTLRFMGNPKDRIKEDPLRSIRVYKFIQRGWQVEPKTLKAVRENFEYTLKNTSSSRIMLEIENMVGL